MSARLGAKAFLPSSALDHGIQRPRLACCHGFDHSQRDRANGSLFHRIFREKSHPRGISKTRSKPPKLLSLIGPCNAKASNHRAFFRALGHTSLTPALDALSALPPRADIRSAKWNVRFGRGADVALDGRRHDYLRRYSGRPAAQSASLSDAASIGSQSRPAQCRL